MIEILLQFTKKACEIAKKGQVKLENSPLYAKDETIESLVTNTDISISNAFRACIEQNFSNLNYMIIDEEKMEQYQDDIFQAVNKTEYQFVIDPIDGTLQYVNSHAMYGISIGVYKNKKPYIGILCLPEQNEMIYFDGKKAYHIKNAFMHNEVRIELKPTLTTHSQIIFAHNWLFKISEKFTLNKTVVLDYYSAVSQALYVLTGRAKAYGMYLKLWDIAGAIPIAEYLGIKIISIDGKENYDCISEEYFTSKMYTRKKCFMCYPRDFKETSEVLIPIDSQAKFLKEAV